MYKEQMEAVFAYDDIDMPSSPTTLSQDMMTTGLSSAATQLTSSMPKKTSNSKPTTMTLSATFPSQDIMTPHTDALTENVEATSASTNTGDSGVASTSDCTIVVQNTPSPGYSQPLFTSQQGN